MSLGERLKNGREERGLTIDEIAARTYIRASHLVALEKGEYHLLPPSRIRYFVRDYARVLNIDPEALLAELPEEIEATPKPVVPPPPPPQPDRSAGKMRFGSKRERTPPPTDRGPESREEEVPKGTGPSDPPSESLFSRRRVPRYSPIDQGNPMLARGLIGVALLLVIGVGIWYFFIADDDEPTETITLASDTAEGSPIRIIGEEGDIEDSDTTEGEVVPAGDSLVLRGTFTGRAWYSISMDGEREDQGTLDSGEVREWRALESFSVSLGNAGGVRFSINGKDVGTLGPRGGTVRGRVITSEGLQGGATTTPSQGRSRSTSRRRRSSQSNGSDNPSLPVPELQPSEPRDGID